MASGSRSGVERAAALLERLGGDVLRTLATTANDAHTVLRVVVDSLQRSSVGEPGTWHALSGHGAEIAAAIRTAGDQLAAVMSAEANRLRDLLPGPGSLRVPAPVGVPPAPEDEVTPEVVTSPERAAELLDAIHEFDRRHLVARGRNTRRQYLEREVAAKMPSLRIVITVRNGVLVGCMHGEQSDHQWTGMLREDDAGVLAPVPEHDLDALRAVPTFHVNLLLVAPQFRRGTTTHRLLAACMAAARDSEAHLLSAHVDPDNKAMVTLIERLGWEKVGVRGGQSVYTIAPGSTPARRT